jgi:hypothetical protein
VDHRRVTSEHPNTGTEVLANTGTEVLARLDAESWQVVGGMQGKVNLDPQTR